DYTKAQGGNNWFYGYYEGDGPYKPSEFKEMIQKETMWGYEWRADGIQFLKQGPNLMHPDSRNKAPVVAVRRWKSPVSGKVRIVVDWETWEKGDGIVGKILLDGKEMDSRVVAGPGPGRKSRAEVRTEVRPGSIVEILCHPNQNTQFDATTFQAMIIQEK
ncbi:MAG TPA: hypothetical protein VIS74_07075, partial [Chthoniobacterales bacterium]